MRWCQVYLQFIVSIIEILSTWLKLKSSINLILDLQNIDKLFNDINESFNYKKLRKNLFILSMIILSIILFICSIVNCFVVSDKFTIMSLCFWFICVTPIFYITLKEIEFLNFLLIIKSKFDLINNKLRYISNEENTTNINNSTKHNDYIILEKMKKFINIFMKNHDATKLILDVYAMHLLLLTTSAFILLTVQIYHIYAHISGSIQLHTIEIIFIIVWVAVQMSLIYLNIYMCSCTDKIVSKI